MNRRTARRSKKSKAIATFSIKSLHVVSLVSLVFYMTSLGIFLYPGKALAAPATIFTDDFEGYAENFNFSSGPWVASGSSSVVTIDGDKAAKLEAASGPGTDEKITTNISASGFTHMTLSFDRKLVSVEGSDHFDAQFRVDVGSFTNLQSVSSPLNTWVTETLNIPIAAWNKGSADIRFQMIGNSTNDTAYVDNVSISGEPIATNPAVSQNCGLDIALVIDSSGSISDSELDQMKDAFDGFVDAFLPVTNSQFSVTDFGTTASVLQSFSSDPTTIKDAIDTPASGGNTNWEDGLVKAMSTFDPRPASPNLIVFASDGNPNKFGNPASAGEDEAAAMNAAVPQANTIKSGGTRIITLGIGNQLDVENLKMISGPVVAPPATVDENADVILADFDTLAFALSNLATQLCPHPTPNVDIAKAVDKATANEGDVLNYTITVSNTGDGAISGLLVEDTLPANTTLVASSFNPAPTNITGNTFQWSVSVGASSSTTISYQVTVNSGLPVGTTDIPNTALMTCPEECPIQVNDSATATTTVTKAAAVTEPTPSAPPATQQPVVSQPLKTVLTAPVLTIDKSVDRSAAKINEELTYTVVIKNTGNGTANNVVLTDKLPAGFYFSEGFGSERTINLGATLAPGDTTTITYKVTVGSQTSSGSHTNTATVKADNHNPVSDTATVSVSVPQVLGAETKPKLEITKDVNHSTANRKDVVTYTVTVKNVGDADATNVVINEKLPQGLQFKEDGTKEKSWNVGTIPPGESVTITYDAVVTEFSGLGRHVNTATVQADDLDPASDTALVDVREPVVLGASTLAETGSGPAEYSTFLLGIVLLLAGGLGFRRARQLA